MSKQNKIKIISWNVNGIRACAKKGLQDFIKTEAPDIFCVQETKAHLEQVEPEIKDLGYSESVWSSAHRKGYSGVASFFKEPPIHVEKGIGISDYDNEGRIVWSTHKQFDLYNIYFPNGGSGDERHQFKQKFLQELNLHLKNQLSLGKNIILVGDYNVAHTEIDVYDPVRLSKESGFLPEERAWFQNFLDLGFIDTFRFFNPQVKNKYSWWSYRELARISNRGWRIDYICVSKGLQSKLISANIMDQTEGSDHCPVVAELNLGD